MDSLQLFQLQRIQIGCIEYTDLWFWVAQSIVTLLNTSESAYCHIVELVIDLRKYLNICLGFDKIVITINKQ